MITLVIAVALAVPAFIAGCAAGYRYAMSEWQDAIDRSDEPAPPFTREGRANPDFTPLHRSRVPPWSAD